MQCCLGSACSGTAGRLQALSALVPLGCNLQCCCASGRPGHAASIYHECSIGKGPCKRGVAGAGKTNEGLTREPTVGCGAASTRGDRSNPRCVAGTLHPRLGRDAAGGPESRPHHRGEEDALSPCRHCTATAGSPVRDDQGGLQAPPLTMQMGQAASRGFGVCVATVGGAGQVTHGAEGPVDAGSLAH